MKTSQRVVQYKPSCRPELSQVLMALLVGGGFDALDEVAGVQVGPESSGGGGH